jgi:hypothetical protein
VESTAQRTPHFVDIATSAGLAVEQVTGSPEVDDIIDSLGAGAAWLDYDGDGDPDLYLAQGARRGRLDEAPPDRLYRNDTGPDGKTRFTDATVAAGLGDTLWSFGVAVGDYDNDGDPDIYLCNWGANRLYRNNGDGTFTDVAAASGVDDPSFSVGAAWSDVDGDGDLDLYVANYVVFDFDRYPTRGEPARGGGPPCIWRNLEVFCGPRNLEPAADRFYRNDGDADGDGVPTFVEVSRQVGLAGDEAYFSLAVWFLDADGDGDDDLYVANDSVQNLFFINDGQGRFEDYSMLSGLAYNEQGNEQASMGIAVGDYDGDGLLDLAVTNFSHDHDTLYRNEGDLLFRDVSYPAGIGTPSYFKLGWGISFVDVDLDGWEDLFVAQGHVYPQVDQREIGTSFGQPNSLYRNRGDGRFEEITERAGPGLTVRQSSRALLPVDLEGDGDLDFLVTNLNGVPQLLRDEAPVGNWLAVSLQATSGHRDGIGVRVRLSAGGRVQTREMRTTTGYAGTTLPVAHFGLGAAERVEWVEVRWPRGGTSRLTDLPGNQRLSVRE